MNMELKKFLKMLNDDGYQAFATKTATNEDCVILNRVRGSSILAFMAGEKGVEEVGVLDYSFELKTNSIFVETLSIRCNHRHCGLGTILIDEVKKRAQIMGCDKINLICFESVRGFYKKLGFKLKRKLADDDLFTAQINVEKQELAYL